MITLARVLSLLKQLTFTKLKDTPKVIEPLKFLRGNAGGTALEFSDIAGGGDMTKSVYDKNNDGIVDTSDVIVGGIQYRWVKDERGRITLEVK